MAKTEDSIQRSVLPIPDVGVRPAPDCALGGEAKAGAAVIRGATMAAVAIAVTPARAFLMVRLMEALSLSMVGFMGFPFWLIVRFMSLLPSVRSPRCSR